VENPGAGMSGAKQCLFPPGTLLLSFRDHCVIFHPYLSTCNQLNHTIMPVKMKKIIPVFYLAGCLLTGLHAQSNLVAAGGDASGSGGSVSYSVGQINFATRMGTGGVLAEGVQQPFEIAVISGIQDEETELNATVFPNPTDDFVQLSINHVNHGSLNYELVDLNGRLIDQKDISTNMTRIKMNSLAAGTYYLKVSDGDKTIKVFKISKYR
jgi:hypothetical protein